MMRRQGLNRSRPTLHRMIGIATLAAAFAPLPRPAFGQATSGVSGMRIGIFGSGNIGSTVGTLWVKAGHQVLFTSRHREALKSLVDGLGPLARTGTVKGAPAFGDVV